MTNQVSRTTCIEDYTLIATICKRQMPCTRNTLLEAITDSSRKRTLETVTSVLTAATTI